MNLLNGKTVAIGKNNGGNDKITNKIKSSEREREGRR